MTFFINVPVANLHALPLESSEVVSQALYGWPVQVLAEESSFKKVRTSDCYEGWILNRELHKTTISEWPVKKVKLIHNAVHIYSLPDVTKQKPLFTLPFEVQLESVREPEEDDFRWIQVRLLDDRCVWVQRANVLSHPLPLNQTEMLALSHQFIGLPYTWGGVSSFGYDCSGFIQMLFRQMGVFLPRDARQQSADPRCCPVELTQLMPGDLIFFGSSQHRITHVGLYLGDHEIIHATAKIAPILQRTFLDDPLLQERYPYRAAGRIQI